MKNNLNKTIVLVITCLASFLTPFMSSALNVALPTISQQFMLTAILSSWVVSAYLLATAIFLVPFGKIADIYGRKKIFLLGIIIYTISSTLIGLIKTAPVFILLRIMQGLGSAMIFTTSVAIITSVFPAGERGKYLGINVAVTYLGLSSGPFIGGVLTEYLSWRSIFFVNGILGLIILILTVGYLKKLEWQEYQSKRIDYVGATIYSLGLLSLIYGLTIITKPLGFILIPIGVVLIVIFVLWEAKVTNPILDVNLFRQNITFAFSNLAAGINYSATFGVGYLLSLYLQHLKKLTASQAGLVLITQPIMMAILSPLAGKISDRIEARITASIGMAITFGALLILIFLKIDTPLLSIVLNLSMLGIGLAIFSSPNMNAIMSSVNKEYYGIASGTLATMRLIGQMFSMAIVMLVTSLFMRNIKIGYENYPLFLKSSSTIFLIYALLCFGGIFASLARGKLKSAENRR